MGLPQVQDGTRYSNRARGSVRQYPPLHPPDTALYRLRWISTTRSSTPDPMMLRFIRPFVTLVSFATLLACDDGPVAAPAGAERAMQSRPSAAAVRPAPECFFPLHARLLPEDPHDVQPSPRFAGFFRILLTGDGEDEGQVRYATSLPVPTIDSEGFDRVLAEIRVRVPVNTPEWTDYNKSAGGGIPGAGIRASGVAPIDPYLATALAISPSDFVARVTVEDGDESESFTGVITPDRGSSGTVREETIRPCFGV